ncbi:hypothetical protein [Chitinophaga solisilvae]|uniref:Uncharacterized protein n=1 Tax=Chitinophaga solisilvae TaxID=1233460 RepID=A0A9Q5D1B8_9BACT|nr:hypothetical protein [Chitinophaga solisilvae]NSL89008.1 hypothetical protein [Chitinophaga solisilvae]
MSQDYYFGKLVTSAVKFENTPAIAVFFDGKELDTIGGGASRESMLLAGKTGKLSFFKYGTTELIADTVITIQKNDVQRFRVAYSTQFNIKGFVKDKPSMGADSLAFQLYLLPSNFYKQKAVDVQLFTYDINSGTMVKHSLVKNVEFGKLNTVVTIGKGIDADQMPVYYTMQYIDPATGNVIPFGTGEEHIWLPALVQGSYTIVTFKDDATGAITADAIELL